MLAVVFPEPDEYELTEVPDPTASSGHVVVRVKSTTICATDYKIYRGKVPFVSYPHIPGHEWGGVVVELGKGVEGLEIGDLVGVEAHIGCNRCARCVEGLYNLCENYGKPHTGHAHIGFTVPGGLAEYCAIPARAAHILPEGLSQDHAAFTDTVGIVLWAFERAGGVLGGECVAVVGPGTLGLLAVQIARALGAGQIITIGIETDRSRLKLAKQMGADEIIIANEGADTISTVRELTSERGADLVVEFAGTQDAARLALEIARRGGRVVLGGATSPGVQLDVDLSTIVRGHLNVFGTVANPQGISGRANILMQKGLVDIGPLISHHLPLSEFSHAWDIFLNREDDVIRVMMHS